MKRTFILCFVSTLLYFTSQAQEHKLDNVITNKDSAHDSNEPIFTSVDIEAAFPGGVTGWCQFLQKHLRTKVPIKNKAPLGRYTVTVLFIVDKDGTISDISIKNDPGYGTAEEVIRVLKKSPKWSPGIQNGKLVKSWRTQSIIFQVEEE